MRRGADRDAGRGRRARGELRHVRERDADVAAYLLTLEARGASPATLRAYGADLDAYATWLAGRGRRPAEATRADVRAYAVHLGARGLAGRSRARALSALRGLYRRLESAGRIDADPSAELVGPRRDGRLPRPVRRPDAERILDAPWGDAPLDLRDAALLELLYGCGLRAAEACGLDRADLGARRLRVRGKGGRERTVPVGAPARDAVAAWLDRGRPQLAKDASDDALLLSSRGLRLEPSAVRRALARRLRDVGLPHRSPHALRHAYATHMLEGGGDLRAIQELLGHASIGTTEIYTRVGVAHLRAVHARAHPRGT